MNRNKLHALFNFISLVSKITDNIPLQQSPDYICEKFKQYIGGFDTFEFSSIFHSAEEREFMKEYMNIWGDTRFIQSHVVDYRKLENLLAFIHAANWDSGTLPSVKLVKFKKYIGECSLIKEYENHSLGIHPVLNKWISDLNDNKILKDDITKLYREFDIDSILNYE